MWITKKSYTVKLIPNRFWSKMSASNKQVNFPSSCYEKRQLSYSFLLYYDFLGARCTILFSYTSHMNLNYVLFQNALYQAYKLSSLLSILPSLNVSVSTPWGRCSVRANYSSSLYIERSPTGWFYRIPPSTRLIYGIK